MNIREISDVFKDTADEITAIKSYNFGWASDRARQGNTEDFQELNEFPRVFFAVPTITGSDQTRKQDTYQVTLFFDDLLGYDNEGDEDPTLQIDKWANLQQYANYFIQRLNKIKQSILPNYLFIPEAPSITFDSFTGIQRMITVQLSFNLVVPTNCDPGVITLVQCIANIVTSSNLTASLTTVLKFAASLEGRAILTADIALVQKVASSLNAFGTLTGDINFVQKVQASLLTSSSVTGNIIIPKLVQASLTGTGTTAADLTVNAPSVGLLLDTYPNAAVAYSLRKLRSAYTGSAIRVRRSSDNTEQNIGFTGNELDTTALLSFCGAGNGFVTTWYDQSGNARNATQTTQANQPQIVSSGVVILTNSKPSLYFDGVNDSLTGSALSNYLTASTFSNISVFNPIALTTNNSIMEQNDSLWSDNANGWAGIYFKSTNNLFAGIFDSTIRQVSVPITANTQITSFAKLVSGNLSISKNNGTFSNVTAGNIGNINNLLTIARSVVFAELNAQEIIFYKTDQTSNLNGINNNVNSFYGIY